MVVGSGGSSVAPPLLRLRRDRRSWGNRWRVLNRAESVFSPGLRKLRLVFGREGPLLRVGILSESKFVQVADIPVDEPARALPRLIVAIANATMSLDLRERAPGSVQGADSRFAMEHLAAPASPTLGPDRLRRGHLASLGRRAFHPAIPDRGSTRRRERYASRSVSEIRTEVPIL